MGLRRLLTKRRAAAFAAAAVVLVAVFGGSPVASSAGSDTFVLTLPANTVAGAPVDVSITAIDPNTNGADAAYTGAKSLTFGGASASPSGAAPTVLAQPFGTATSVTFDNGTATLPAAMVLYEAASPSITVVDATNAMINNGGGTPITVAPANAAKLDLAAASPSPTAGDGDALTITAKDAYGNTATGYSGNKTLRFTGANPAPSGDAPTVNTIPFGSDTPMTFTSGASNGVMTLFKTGATTVMASDGTIDSGSGVAVNVGPAALKSFTWSHQPAVAQTAGSPFAAEITAFDTYGNVKSDYSGTGASVTGLHDGPTSGIASYSVAWSGGVGSGTFTGYRTEPSGAQLTVSASSISATSSAFVVNPGPIGTFSWTTQPAAGQTAGAAIAASVTAYDTFGNVKTDYDGSTATKSGLNDAPNASQTASYGTWSNGVDSGPFVDYRTDNPTAIAFADGSATGGTSTSFGVAPGPLASFKWTTQPATPQIAGGSFGAAVTAYDAYGNVKTDYTGTATFTGLHDAPNATATATSVVSWSNGVGSGTFTGYRTEPSPGTQLTVTDSPITASSTNVVVKPAILGSFEWTTQPSSPQVAGTPFHATATAYDIYGNVKTDYAGSPTFSGLHDAPNGTANASYAMPFTSGVGTGTFTGYRTEPTGTSLVIKDSSIQRASSSFNVDPAAPASLLFTKQPTETCASQPTTALCASDTTKSAIINGAATGVRVQVKDTYGNLHYNTSVKLAIDTGHNPGNTTLLGTTTRPTDSTGVAIFSDLHISVVGVGYELAATAPPASPTAGPTLSAPFIIAQTVTTCSATSCPTSTAKSTSTLTASASGTNLSGNTLGLALSLNGPARPVGVCPTFGEAPGLDASYVNVNEVVTTGPRPTLTITWTIPKAIVQKIPNIPQNNNNGASHYDICLGSQYLTTPAPAQGFPTKNGGFAQPVFDPVFGVTFFWGIIPDCPKAPTAPCMQSRTKTPIGDLVLRYLVPYPWDPTGWAGGGV